MKRLLAVFACSVPLMAFPAAAQTPPIAAPNAGTLVLMTGSAELEVANDEAVANFFYEAQDANLTKAQALVNQRVAEAMWRDAVKGPAAAGRLREMLASRA